MNKRQRKKKYKKEHGYNPPSNRATKKAVNSLVGALRDFQSSVKTMLKQFPRSLKNLTEGLQTMQEDEFEKSLQNLTQEQQIIAKRIRERQNSKTTEDFVAKQGIKVGLDLSNNEDLTGYVYKMDVKAKGKEYNNIP